MNLIAGTLLQGGKYRIVRFISSGGFGNTYEAIHTIFNQRVALKEYFVKDFCNRDPDANTVSVATQTKVGLVEKLKKKFVAEASMIYKMNHTGIVKVLDIFEENNTAYYVMEYIDGESLSSLLHRRGGLPEEEALRYIRQVCEALKYVHSFNCLHLDLKPGNIMLTKSGDVKLIDFGASKQYDEASGQNTSTLMLVTPGFAPPEQVASSFTKFSPATDIYALAGTLYNLLTNMEPIDVSLRFSGEELHPLPFNISAPTCHAIEAGMRLNRNERPQSIDEFLALLDAPAPKTAQEPEPVPEEPTKTTVVIEPKPIYPEPESVSPQPTPKPKPKTPNEKRKPSCAARIFPILCSIVVLIVINVIRINNRHSHSYDYYGDGDTIPYIPDDDSLAVFFGDEYVASDEAAADDEESLIWQYYFTGQDYYNQENYKEAMVWFKKAAEYGDSDSENRIGFMYDQGLGVSQNYTEANKWFKKAAEKGNMSAQYNLGLNYEYGLGVPVDINKAKYWLKKAADQGFNLAIDELNDLN